MIKNIAKLGLILLLICGISTGILAYVNGLTAPVIKENEAKQQLIANKKVLPLAKEFNEVNEDVSIGISEDGKEIGYTVKVSPFGYGGKINMIVGINMDMTVSGVEILSLSETPGLGAKAQSEDFLGQFKGKTKEIKIKENITAISGATITSTAVTDGVKEAVLKVEGIGGSN